MICFRKAPFSSLVYERDPKVDYSIYSNIEQKANHGFHLAYLFILFIQFLSLGHIPRLNDLQYGMDMRHIQRLLIFTSDGPSASYRMLDLLNSLAMFRETFNYLGYSLGMDEPGVHSFHASLDPRFRHH